MASQPPIFQGKVYQLKFHLIDVSPMVWRRLLVRDDTSIAQLHGILQLLMGRTNLHLHCFVIYGKDDGIAYSGGMSFSDNPRKVLLKGFQFEPSDKFRYDYLDWFHITMKITVLNQYLKGLVKVDEETGKQFQEYLDKIKWYLWHGNTYKALYYLESFDDEVYLTENEYEHLASFKKRTADFSTYIQNNQHLIINYGERYRNGEIYTSTFAESTINEVVSRRFCKKQQMQWSKRGAHAMLVTRTKVLNGDLVDCFKQWFPNLKIEEGEHQKAA